MIDYKGEASFFCDKIWFATQTSLQIAFFSGCRVYDARTD
jgi:hypothetical protein